MCFKVFGYPDFEQARKMAKKEIEESKTEVKKQDEIKRLNTNKIECKLVFSQVHRKPRKASSSSVKEAAGGGKEKRISSLEQVE